VKVDREESLALQDQMVLEGFLGYPEKEVNLAQKVKLVLLEPPEE